MTGPDRPHPSSVVDAIKNVFDMSPEGEGGIGPTLGEDVGAPAQRRADPRAGAKPMPQADDDEDGLLGAINPKQGE